MYSAPILMPQTYGGFSGNPVISAFLAGIQTQFTQMVTCHSVLLTRYTNDPAEVIRIAQVQAYPRIGLRLASAKQIDNSPLFLGIGNDLTQIFPDLGATSAAQQLLFDRVVNFMTSANSPFAEGITNVAATMTAAILISQIPVNNDIKNIELARDKEKAALDDLDRIIDLYAQTTSTTTINDAASASTDTSKPFYLALDIDKTTLPVSYFNVGNPEDSLVIEDTYPGANVNTISSLTVPSTSVCFCYYYVSGTEYESVANVGDTPSTPSLTLHPPVEGAFFINTGDTDDSICATLSDYLNEAALTRESNVISAPNSGEYQLLNITIPRKALYPFETDPTYDKKMVTFQLLQKIDFLVFDSRRVSSIVHRELIIIDFYTLDKVLAASKILYSNPLFQSTTFTYQGAYSPSTTYTPGQLVDYLYGLYACSSSALGEPPTNTSYWTPVFTEPTDLLPIKGAATNYIDGLVYGLYDDYTQMSSIGPKSTILDVQYGSLKVINAVTGAKKNYIDTFYFQLAPGFTSVTGILKLRVSSVDLKHVPDIEDYLNPNDNSLDIDLVDATPDEVALAILKAVYVVSEYTLVLCSLAFCNALEFTAFRRTLEEVKQVVDIIQVPPGLNIATGTNEIERSPYRNKPRSLILNTVLVSSRERTSLVSNLENNHDPAFAVTPLRRSSRLQAVEDKLKFLTDVSRLYPYVNIKS